MEVSSEQIERSKAVWWVIGAMTVVLALAASGYEMYRLVPMFLATFWPALLANAVATFVAAALGIPVGLAINRRWAVRADALEADVQRDGMVKAFIVEIEDNQKLVERLEFEMRALETGALGYWPPLLDQLRDTAWQAVRPHERQRYVQPAELLAQIGDAYFIAGEINGYVTILRTQLWAPGSSNAIAPAGYRHLVIAIREKCQALDRILGTLVNRLRGRV